MLCRGRERRPPMRMRGASVIAVVVMGVFLLTVCGGAEASTNKRFFGVTYAPYPSQVVPDALDLHRMSHGGVAWVRSPFLWRMIQPHPGTFDWSIPDAVVARFASRGISVLPELFGSATFAKHSGTRPPLHPASARKQWKRFLRAVDKRYGPNGTFWREPGAGMQSAYHSACGCSAAPRPIHRWQIWNEPNLRSYFHARPAAKRYAGLVRLSHKALTSVDPTAKIVLAGLTGRGNQTAWHFLNRLYKTHHGFKREFDAVALHPYAARLRVVRKEIRLVRKVMRKHHQTDTPLWITELGWSSSTKPSPYGLNKGKQGQKHLLNRSFRTIARHRRRWHIAHLMWFHWRDPARDVPSGCSFCGHAGLIRHRGKPKPAWHAYKRLALN